MTTEKPNRSNELLLRLDTVIQNAGLEEVEYSKGLRVLRQMPPDLLKVFGLEGDLATLYQEQNRDYPTVITYEEFPGEDAVRLKVFHNFGGNKIEITFDSKNKRLIGFLVTGELYPGHVSGSRWYGEWTESFLEKNPDVEEYLTSEQVEALEGEKARLVSYYFFPNSDAHYQNYLEGCARILYFWDLSEDKWTYVAHSEKRLRD